jgi:hypothetical protein
MYQLDYEILKDGKIRAVLLNKAKQPVTAVVGTCYNDATEKIHEAIDALYDYPLKFKK